MHSRDFEFLLNEYSSINLMRYLNVSFIDSVNPTGMFNLF